MPENRLISTVYDIITVIISIADVTTDIIVLFSFYFKGRSTFFTISLIILCIAQCAYACAFMWRYDTLAGIYDRSGSIFVSVCFFFVFLPFGPIIPIIIFLTDDSEWFADWFEKITQFSPENDFSSYGKSQAAKWMIQKLNKHIGFIIEAGVEAFPQSLLQICAIVYYNEANYVSIASILISMISVMTKSLIFSKGIEIKTFIWTWFCVVVDFFGIFFTLSWVFYSNETLLVGDFLGYFNFIGELWFYKVLCSICPCIACLILFWGMYYLWYIIYEVCENQRIWYNFGLTIFWVICGTTAVVLFCAVLFIVLEVFCFTMVAFVAYTFFTRRWIGFESKTMSQRIKAIITFIGGGSGPKDCDTIVRVLAVNYAIHKGINSNLCSDTVKYVNKIESTQGIEAIQKIRYRDIRNNCHQKDNANIFPALWRELKELFVDASDDVCKSRDGCLEYYEIIIAYFGFLFACVLFPVFVFSKIFQILFPYFIVAYLYFENDGSHGLWYNIDTFQLVMLFAYIGLQLILMVLGILAFRINYWLWHISPGNFYVNPTSKTITKDATEWCERIAWFPKCEKLLVDIYGADIARIVIDYVKQIKLEKEDV